MIVSHNISHANATQKHCIAVSGCRYLRLTSISTVYLQNTWACPKLLWQPKRLFYGPSCLQARKVVRYKQMPPTALLALGFLIIKCQRIFWAKVRGYIHLHGYIRVMTDLYLIFTIAVRCNVPTDDININHDTELVDQLVFICSHRYTHR